jgi:hypothetical protein
MKKINLCIDIDSTVTMPDYWVPYANDYFGTNYHYHDDTVESYFIENKFTNEKFDGFYHLFAKDMHRTAKIRPYAAEAINNLREFCNIYYVTAREKNIEPITIQWLKDHDVYSDVYHLGSFYKNQKAKELNCHVFIEDNLETAKNLVEDSIKVLLIDTGFNRYENPDQIVRVFNWQEAHEKISYHYHSLKNN